MKMKKLLILLILISQIFLGYNFPFVSSYTTITVPDDYSTIQAAIDAASPGDTIFVESGTYNESLDIGESIILVGEDKFSTIINGLGAYNVIYVDSTNASIREFTITNGGTGVYLNVAGGSQLLDLIVYNHTWAGIESYGSSDISIIKCVSYDNHDGIEIESACSAEIIECNIFNNDDDGIDCANSNNLRILNTSISHNTWGTYLVNADMTTVCSSQVFNNSIYGLSFRDCDKTYVTRTSCHNNTADGLSSADSSGVIANSNFTWNREDGLDFDESLFKLRNCGIWDNYLEPIRSYESTIDARYCWWNSPGGPTLSSGDILFDPWQTYLDQPDVLISDFRCHKDLIEWLVVFPDEKTPKPLGCAAASVSDWLASAFITTKLRFPFETLDTQGMYVNQTTGEVYAYPDAGVLTFGGPIVNPIVKRAENPGTPSTDRSPVKFYNGGDTFYFQYTNGTNIPGASLPLSVINDDEDLFVIERYLDSEEQIITICYGFGWKGTYAAGKYFDSELYPQQAQYTTRWIIVKWDDSNMDGFVNTPDQGDTYTLIATG
jgi:hypothetical protein